MLRTISELAGELAAVTREATPDTADVRLSALSTRYGRALSVNAAQLRKVLEKTSTIFEERLSGLVELGLRPRALMRQLGKWSTGTAKAEAEAQAAKPAPAAVLGSALTGRASPEQTGLTSAVERSIAEESQLRNLPPAKVLELVLEHLEGVFQFSRLALLVLGPGCELAVRTARGAGADNLLRLRVPVDARGKDIFSTTFYQIRDLAVPDVFTPDIYPLVPKWYFTSLGAPAFLLLPMAAQRRSIGRRG